MCLYATHKDPKIADRDITVYKVIVTHYFCDHESKTVSVGFKTPYKNRPVNPGRCAAEGERSVTRSSAALPGETKIEVTSGYIHSHTDENSAKKHAYYSMYEFQSRIIINEMLGIHDEEKNLRHMKLPLFKSLREAEQFASAFINAQSVSKDTKSLFSPAYMVIECTVPSGAEYWEDEEEHEIAATEIIYPE